MKTAMIAMLSFFPWFVALTAWAQVPLDSQFTYTGRITEQGTPMTQQVDMEFRLWDDPVAGLPLGPTLTFDGAAGNPDPVDVDQGLFMAPLDFGVEVFNGEARWLEIAVRPHPGPPGGGAGGGPPPASYTTMSPRQPVRAVPYALQWRGGFVDDNLLVGIGTTDPQFRLDVRSPTPRAIFGWVTNPTGDTHGVFGQSASDEGNGVTGFASANSGETVGVFGLSDSATGRGVYGLATAPSGLNFGVVGQANGSSARAVYGLATDLSGFTHGVFGETASTGGHGVHGMATAATGNARGVSGTSESSSGIGVYGVATSATGSTRGVFGLAASPDGYGGYFQDRSYLEGPVGIGTLDPVTRLHVQGSDDGTDVLVRDDQFARMRMVATDPASDVTLTVQARGSAGVQRAEIGTVSSHDVVLFTNLQERLRIESGGDVGIGTTDPVARLHVQGSDDTTDVLVRDDEFARMRMVATDPASNVTLTVQARGSAGAQRAEIGTVSSHDLVLFTNLQERLRIESGGGVGIGTQNVPPNTLLAVGGTLRCEEAVVQLEADWPDYVFAPDYPLMPLDELESHLVNTRHLPGIPTASEIESSGVNIGEMQAKTIQKVEELTLYVLQLNRALNEVRTQKRVLEERLAALEAYRAAPAPSAEDD